MKMKLVLAAAALTLTAGVSNALVLDFGLAAKNNEQAFADLSVVNINGVNIQFAAFNVDSTLVGGDHPVIGPGTAPYSYFDHDGNAGAGVGVCQSPTTFDNVGSGNACDPSSDDNITARLIKGQNSEPDITEHEMLALRFAGDVYINQIKLSTEGHNDGFDNKDDEGNERTGLDGFGNDIQNDSAILGVIKGNTHNFKGIFDLVVGGSCPGCIDSGFKLKAGDWLAFTYYNEQIYLNEITLEQVPLPAGVFLLLGGLGMMGVASRRKKA